MEFMWQGISGLLPIVLLVGLWFYFMTKIKASRRQELLELFQHMQRVEGLLDRIAVTLERRTTA
jgi:preprotein translocase subunit YajC